MHDVSKRYGHTTAFDHVTLSVSSGTVYGLIGTNGAGKSTLMRVLATLERPTSGKLTILDLDAERASREIRRAVGYVPDDNTAFRGITVGEHLDFLAQCYGLSYRERLANVDTMLQLVELDRLRHVSTIDLSRGFRQRLSLASALVHDPQLLIMDEPLSGLDFAGREEMLEVLSELRRMGKTIVLASHAVEDVRRLCDAVGLLHKGVLVDSGTLDRVLETESAESLPEALTQTLRGLAA